jgi:hypothetical protein
MEPKKFRLVEITVGVPIPVPRDLTPAEEAAILSQAKADFDPVASEAECRELLRLRDQGRLVSGEELLATLDELEALYRQDDKESA